MFKKIFITGGAGFVGSHVVEKFFECYPDSKIIILDKLTYAGNLKFLDKVIKSNKVFFIKNDIINYKSYEKFLNNVDLAINIAAESHVDNSFKSPLSFTLTNTYGSHVFLLNCIKRKVKKIIHISSDEIYGEIVKGKNVENNFANPTNPYSASKAAADIIINSYKYSYKKEIIIVRPNNIYGIRQYPEKLIPSCILRLINNKKILLHGKGNNVRYYLSVKDFSSALIKIAEEKDKGIFNIGSDTSFKNITLAKIICKMFNKNPKKFIKFVVDRPYNDKRYAVSSIKIKKLGWKENNNLVNDLPYIINWYKKNKSLYYKK
jgi:dTDP-glucose 4,6-dehydratase